jgi:quinone-modifying oxidoreductase subunit QmoA
VLAGQPTACAEACPVETDNKFNLGLDKSKAIYLPYNNAYPQRYMIDMAACKGETCSACVSACAYDAIKLNQKEHSFELKTKSVIWATGWEPYNAKRLENLGYGKYKGVVTNLEMERLAAANGPGSGKIIIPGLDREIKSVVFVQCAGSRDETHLEYCSSVCCLASMKQAGYLREQFPEAEIYIYYIDVRTPGFFEDFYTDTQRDGHIHFIRGKVAKVFEDKGRLVVEAEDTIEGGLRQTAADLVVLATGMQPSILKNDVPGRKHLDENGFFLTRNGVIACGVATGPKDVASAVQEATGAAMKAIHILKGGN